MEERTRAYLRGRFGDYYRRADLAGPPAAERREWGYIPWTRAAGTTMVRHNDLLGLTGGGSLQEFLARERPRHVYFSAGRYDRPGARTMDNKGWRGSDLVFDLDADHLPDVDPGDTYAEMLEKCKGALNRLLDFLENDFAFEELTVAFSGSRGYHVHVRDDDVFSLDREERREIVDYLQGAGVTLDAVRRKETVAGHGLKNPADKWVLKREGGWGSRMHRHLADLVETLREVDEESATDRLRDFDGIGEKTAAAVLETVRNNPEELSEGNIDAGGRATRTLAKKLLEEVIENERAPIGGLLTAAIDEPVTTDINRLIRLPGSLHGGSGLAVRPIARDNLAGFDPLVEAVPETFRDQDITVEVREQSHVNLGGDSFTLPAGEHSVPEYAGVFLMARGRAEKGKEA